MSSTTLSYKSPTILKVSGCDDDPDNPFSTTDSTRVNSNGGLEPIWLTIEGFNFGGMSSGVMVSINGQECTSVTRGFSDFHISVKCKLPAGAGSKLELVVTV